jgi:hypothetical protein
MLLLLSILEGCLGAYRQNEITLRARLCTHNLGGGFLPGTWSLEEFLFHVAQEAHVNQDFDKLGESTCEMSVSCWLRSSAVGFELTIAKCAYTLSE